MIPFAGVGALAIDFDLMNLKICAILLMGLWAYLLLSLCIRLYFMIGPIAFGLQCHEFGILANHFVLVFDPSLWAQNSLCCRLHFGPNQLHLGLAPAMN